MVYQNLHQMEKFGCLIGFVDFIGYCFYCLLIHFYDFQAYTQYIPLSIYDLQSWMGSPSIYVYDCSNAGMIVKLFDQFAAQHDKEILVNTILFCF